MSHYGNTAIIATEQNATIPADIRDIPKTYKTLSSGNLFVCATHLRKRGNPATVFLRRTSNCERKINLQRAQETIISGPWSISDNGYIRL